MANQSVEEICDELLQGLCEGDLSYSATLTSSHNHSNTSNNSKLDKMMDDALFDLYDDKEEEQRPSFNYPVSTFYGLPMQVLDYLKEFRGITKLYG